MALSPQKPPLLNVGMWGKVGIVGKLGNVGWVRKLKPIDRPPHRPTFPPPLVSLRVFAARVRAFGE